MKQQKQAPLPITLYHKDREKWQGNILSTSCECLTAQMKCFVLKWPEIRYYLTKKGQTDKFGYTRVSLGYIATCLGVDWRTAQRLIEDMHTAKYLDKALKRTEGVFQEMRLKVQRCVWDCEFHTLPKTNKGRGQRKYLCADCGSRDVEVEAVRFKVLCYECGSVHYQDKDGRKVMFHDS